MGCPVMMRAQMVPNGLLFSEPQVSMTNQRSENIPKFSEAPNQMVPFGMWTSGTESLTHQGVLAYRNVPGIFCDAFHTTHNSQVRTRMDALIRSLVAGTADRYYYPKEAVTPATKIISKGAHSAAEVIEAAKDPSAAAKKEIAKKAKKEHERWLNKHSHA